MKALVVNAKGKAKMKELTPLPSTQVTLPVRTMVSNHGLYVGRGGHLSRYEGSGRDFFCLATTVFYKVW